jgi:hypothetical protein
MPIGLQDFKDPSRRTAGLRCLAAVYIIKHQVGTGKLYPIDRWCMMHGGAHQYVDVLWHKTTFPASGLQIAPGTFMGGAQQLHQRFLVGMSEQIISIYRYENQICHRGLDIASDRTIARTPWVISLSIDRDHVQVSQRATQTYPSHLREQYRIPTRFPNAVAPSSKVMPRACAKKNGMDPPKRPGPSIASPHECINPDTKNTI